MCKNVTQAVEELHLDVTDERYNVIYRKKGERSCNTTVKRLTKLPKKLKKLGVEGKVHINNCRLSIKLLACTLNPKGLEWVSYSTCEHMAYITWFILQVCSQKKIKSVTHDPAPPVNPQTGGNPDEPGTIPVLG